MIHLAIVEDEMLYVQQLTEYLERYQKESGQQIKITRFSDGDGIVEGYKGDYDIILMDIQMRFMDGMSAAEQIRRLDQEVIIMFITNMTQYAIRGYEVDALDYMVKPIEYFSFSQKLERAIGRIKKKEQHYISVSTEDGMLKLAVDDIYYVESQGHAMNYHTARGVCVSRGTMKDLEEVLTPYGFFRSGKGFLVNMKYVDGIQENCCVIRGEKLPISRMKRKPFMDALVQHMSEVIR